MASVPVWLLVQAVLFLQLVVQRAARVFLLKDL
jgi:hypothetical protein